MFYYESHLGVWYSKKEKIADEDLYCEICGDGDIFLGFFETEEEFLKEYENRIKGF